MDFPITKLAFLVMSASCFKPHSFNCTLEQKVCQVIVVLSMESFMLQELFLIQAYNLVTLHSDVQHAALMGVIECNVRAKLNQCKYQAVVQFTCAKQQKIYDSCSCQKFFLIVFNISSVQSGSLCQSCYLSSWWKLPPISGTMRNS